MPEGRTWKNGEFCWYELGTTDAADAKKFYGSLFGWDMADQPMGELGTYTLVQKDERDHAGLYEMKGPMFEGVPPHWLVYVAVASANDAAAKAQSLGGSIVMQPMDVP